MLKKIVLAAALTATASFATWNYFPVQEAGKGQAELGFTYGMPAENVSTGDLFAGVRFTVIQNLEIATKFDYRLFTDYDGNDGPDGIDNLPIMLRYQFMPILNAFVDVSLPIGDEEVIGWGDGLGVYFGVQFSQNFGIVNFGSELGLQIRTEGDDEVSPPYNLHIGLEGDFAVSQMFVPYVGVDFDMWLGEFTHDGDSAPGADDSGTLGIAPYLGINIAINPMFYVDLSARFGIGEDYYGEDTPIWLTGKFGINF